MPATERVYPDWVQKYRTQGTTVKKKGDAYYLYKRTSKRVPGKKYPQPVDTYIGIITPEGVIETQNRKLNLSEIIVAEYGFTKAINDICPTAWKKAVGKNWEDVLGSMILKWSPNSYMREKYQGKSGDIAAHAASLSRRINDEYDVEFKSLEILKYIYIVKIGKEEAVSHVSEEQQALLDKLHVKLLQ